MAKGNVAKENLIKRFAEAVGEDYAGTDETGKKYYFWSTEGGERLQVCLTLTVPKTPVNASRASDVINFSDSDDAPPFEMPMQEDEKATIDRLIKELDL